MLARWRERTGRQVTTPQELDKFNADLLPDSELLFLGTGFVCVLSLVCFGRHIDCQTHFHSVHGGGSDTYGEEGARCEAAAPMWSRACVHSLAGESGTAGK